MYINCTQIYTQIIHQYNPFIIFMRYQRSLPKKTTANEITTKTITTATSMKTTNEDKASRQLEFKLYDNESFESMHCKTVALLYKHIRANIHVRTDTYSEKYTHTISMRFPMWDPFRTENIITKVFAWNYHFIILLCLWHNVLQPI